MLWQKSPQYQDMTTEEYVKTDEGKRWQEATRKWQEWASAPGESGKAGTPPPGGRQPVSQGRQPITSPGQAQPKSDPAAKATRPKDAARNEIARALKEMFPELDPGKIQVLSGQLAEDYQRERTAAVDSLRPQAPMAEPTEQMEFDEAYQGMRANERAEDRMKKRMEQQLLKDQADQRRAGQSKPKQPKYGQWIDTDPYNNFYAANWQDEDGDGIDDRWQIGPGQPAQYPITRNGYDPQRAGLPSDHRMYRPPGGAPPPRFQSPASEKQRLEWLREQSRLNQQELARQAFQSDPTTQVP